MKWICVGPKFLQCCACVKDTVLFNYVQTIKHSVAIIIKKIRFLFSWAIQFNLSWKHGDETETEIQSSANKIVKQWHTHFSSWQCINQASISFQPIHKTELNKHFTQLFTLPETSCSKRHLSCFQIALQLWRYVFLFWLFEGVLFLCWSVLMPSMKLMYPWPLNSCFCNFSAVFSCLQDHKSCIMPNARRGKEWI